MAASASCGILYIEDNPDNVLLVEGLLEQRPGLRLLSAHLGQLGLALAREHRPDVILLDLHRPAARRVPRSGAAGDLRTWRC